MVKKRKKKKKVYHKNKLPPNACYWLTTTKNPKEIQDFVERGNERQKKSLKAAIDYRLWQIQEKAIDKDFFGDLDVKKLDFNITKEKRAPRKKKVVEETVNKPIDLFDMDNIKDLVS